MSATEDLNKNVQQAAEDAAKAAQQAYDAYKHLINVKAVATNGQLGALSAADTLADAPVGDAAKLRSDIGAVAQSDIGALAKKDSLAAADVGAMRDDATLMSIPVGAETWKFRQLIGLGNEKSGRDALGLSLLAHSGDYADLLNSPIKFYGFNSGVLQPYGEQQLAFVEANDKNANPQQGWQLPTQWCNAFYASGTSKNNAIGIATGQGPGHEYWISGRNSWDKGVFRTWSKLLHSNNTSIDSNGFVKGASPIFRVGDPELTAHGGTFIADGHGAANEEARGVSCERISEGVYKITGALGFADDNVWTIETPRDDNNQPILWVNTAQDPQGVITIETYHREHPDAPPFARNTVEGKADGDRIDIPSGRWIDLRLKMPEKQKS